jgi:[ribosomal protein S18]-alanine N-acetyltransferase
MAYMIRPMQLDDVPQAVQIDKECFPLNKQPMSYKSDLLYNQMARYIVTYDDESPDKASIIGVLGFWLMAGEAHIMTVGVRKNYRRQGIGQLMLKSAIELAISCSAFAITLEVRRSNTDALSLYVKHGFTERGVRKNYYNETNEDAVIMTKELDNL